MEIVFGRVKNIVGKGENACYQHFLLYPQYFQKLSFLEVLKAGLCGKGLMTKIWTLLKLKDFEDN